MRSRGDDDDNWRSHGRPSDHDRHGDRPEHQDERRQGKFEENAFF